MPTGTAAVLPAPRNDQRRTRSQPGNYRALLDDASDAILVCDESDRVLIANKCPNSSSASPPPHRRGTIGTFLQAIRCQNAMDITSWYQTLHLGRW